MKSMLIAMRKFWHLGWPDRLLLAESLGALAVASFFIALLPFRTVAAAASVPVRRLSPMSNRARATVDRVRWSIAAVSARVPWRAVCFQKGLAAHWMLRRRGMPSVMYYGAALRPDTELAAHVWVRSGELDVIGCETATDYALLATFPAHDQYRPNGAHA